MHETFGSLLRDSAHWEFEIFLMLLFDGLVLGILWPFLSRHWKHHVERDKREKPPLVYFSGGGNDGPEKWPDPGLVTDWSGRHPEHSPWSASTRMKPGDSFGFVFNPKVVFDPETVSYEAGSICPDCQGIIAAAGKGKTGTTRCSGCGAIFVIEEPTASADSDAAI